MALFTQESFIASNDEKITKKSFVNQIFQERIAKTVYIWITSRVSDVKESETTVRITHGKSNDSIETFIVPEVVITNAFS